MKFKDPKIINILTLLVILILSLSIIVFNVTGLDVGRDEGVHAYVAKVLAFEGKYALKTGREYLLFDRRIAVGPTVIIPTAVVYKLFGFSIQNTRIIPGVYFILFIFCFFLLVKKLFGNATAFISSLLILSAQWPFWRNEALFNPIYRTLTGESAGLFFLTLALLVWKEKAFNKVLSSLIIGFSILTKYQFALALLPLFLINLIDKNKFKLTVRNIFGSLLYTCIAFVPFVSWMIFQYFNMPSQEFWDNVYSFKNFSGQTFDLSIMRIKQNIVDKWGELNPNTLKMFFTLPALCFGWVWLYMRKLSKNPRCLFMLVFSTIWMTWYLFSRGYIRYEIPGLYFSFIWLAVFFIEEIQSGFYPKRMFLACMFMLLASYGLYILYRESKVVEQKYSQDMANYIYDNLTVVDFPKVLTSNLDYNVELFVGNSVAYSFEHIPEKAPFLKSYPTYLLTKDNDTRFSYYMSTSILELVYKSGDWNLYKVVMEPDKYVLY